MTGRPCKGCGQPDARREFGWQCLDCYELWRRDRPTSAGDRASEYEDLALVLPALAGRDREIAEAAIQLVTMNRAKIARAVGVSRSTVDRRLGQILENAPYLQRYARELAADGGPRPATQQSGISVTLDGIPVSRIFGVDLDEPRAGAMLEARLAALPHEGELPEDVTPLAPDELSRLSRMLQGTLDAARLRRLMEGEATVLIIATPPVRDVEDGGTIVIRGSVERLFRVTTPHLRTETIGDLIATGRHKVMRVFRGPPRCWACGRMLKRAKTGRPPKYCRPPRQERCRSRWRRLLRKI